MPRDYAEEPRSRVRRRDRAVEDEVWIKAMLHKVPMAALATVQGDQPFINTNLFVYDEAANVIYMHTARLGRTQSNIEQQERVCFSIMEMGRLLPAETAFGFSVEYAGVTVFGTASVVASQDEGRHAMEMLVTKYASHLVYGQDYAPAADSELARTSIYRIEIEEWSGKKKEAPPDFPGAFLYGKSTRPGV
jgi:nitroimidazol reductase NimA-like FMN-containing flavoprotein (pyridoxamine 5'-phosphate oxidase superfamily)